MRLLNHKVLVAVLGLVPVVQAADALPASFTLGKYVPGDWWMYIHFAHNPERAWLEKEWAEVWDELAKSGVDKDLLNLVTGLLSDEDRSKTEATIKKSRELLSGVDWNALFDREVVISERIGPPLPHYALMTRGAEGSGEKNAKGLAAILEYLVSFSDKVKLEQEKLDDIETWTVRVQVEDFKYSPILFRRGDIIGLVTSKSAFDEIAALMKGAADKTAVVNTSRFKEALKQVKAPEDAILYFDARLLMKDMESFMDYGFAKAGKDEGERAGLSIVKKGLGMLDVFDYQIVSVEMNGHQELTHTAGKWQADKLDSPMAKICRGHKAFDRFDKYVPESATGFSMDTMIDWGLLYKTVIDFVEKNIPEGAQGVAEFKGQMASVGFDIERDVFSWLSGEVMSVQMPPAVVTPMGGGDFVAMVRVKDAKIAAEKVGGAINWIKAMLEKEAQQTLLYNVNPSGLEGFTEVTHPMFAMFLRPVWGVRDEWLMIGSSSDAIRKCLDVASGKSPSILKNERFQKEGLTPKGPVTAASFADTSGTAQELGQALGMASMVGGMMVAGIPGDPNDPDTKKGKEVVQKAFSILMKLSPVVAKLDFYSSEASITTCDGAYSRTEKVVTYKPSTEKAAKKAE